MADKKLTKEQVEALEKCKTKEEVEKFGKENDQLTDEELEKMTGGGLTALHIPPDSGGPDKFV
ncbi:MAG: hypothetical protein MJ048_05260 [Acidaminococcaceae bacterium]|nr:hypothetical protein [Acidaminococcaceae bacterium]